MIGKKYKAHKDNVIDLFNNYKAKRGDVSDGIDIKFLEGRVESLKKGKFTLAVAGEVKAGKSTFINALLGADILPSDVLQASNAIVEIFKSETSFLKVRYADGTEESVYDDRSLSIDDHDALYLNRLKTGHALCHKEGMGRPVECAVLSNVNSCAIEDDKVKRLMASLTPKPLHSYQAYQIDAHLGEAGKELAIKFFNSLLILQSDKLVHLRETAKGKMKQILALKNVAHLFNDSLFSDYFSLQIDQDATQGYPYL